MEQEWKKEILVYMAADYQTPRKTLCTSKSSKINRRLEDTVSWIPSWKEKKKAGPSFVQVKKVTGTVSLRCIALNRLNIVWHTQP